MKIYFRRSVLFIFCLLLQLYGVDDSFYSRFYTDKIPSLIGYSQWVNSNSYIRVNDVERKNPIELKLELNSPRSEEFMVSPYADFRGAKWRKMTDEITWMIDNVEDMIILWVVFKRFNKMTSKYEVTEPLSYIYFRKNTYKKAILLKNSYWDLSEQKIVMFSKVKSDFIEEDISKRYNYSLSKLNVRLKTVKDVHEILGNIMINKNFYLDFLYNYVEQIEVNDLFSLFDIKHMSYDKEQQINVKFQLYLYNQFKMEETSSFYEKVKENFHFNSLQMLGSGMGSDIYDYLIIDVRGLKFTPSMFPIIINQSSEIVFNGFYYEQFDKPFVRMYRTSINSNIPDIIKERKDQRVLFIKAESVLPDDSSLISITNSDERLLRGNKKNVRNFSEGNFYILMD